MKKSTSTVKRKLSGGPSWTKTHAPFHLPLVRLRQFPDSRISKQAFQPSEHS